jgi:hypothetical protein
MVNLTASHYQVVTRLLRYLKGSPGLGLFFSASPTIQCNAFSDSECATCPSSRKSITNFCIFIRDSLISWKSKKQATQFQNSPHKFNIEPLLTLCVKYNGSTYIRIFKFHSPLRLSSIVIANLLDTLVQILPFINILNILILTATLLARSFKHNKSTDRLLHQATWSNSLSKASFFQTWHVYVHAPVHMRSQEY